MFIIWYHIRHQLLKNGNKRVLADKKAHVLRDQGLAGHPAPPPDWPIRENNQN